MGGSQMNQYGYDRPDAFIALDRVTINVPKLTRIHAGAFFGGKNPGSDSAASRSSLHTIDLTGSPVTYMDNYNGIAYNDGDTAY
jgi:hypothetical protein